MRTIKRICTIVLVASAILLIGATVSFCTPTPTRANEVSFGVGENVSHTTKQQFISIASDQAWSIAVEYFAPEDHTDWCTLSRTSGEGNGNVLMSFGTNPLDEARTLILYVTFPSETIRLHFTQRAESSGNAPADLSGWTELPSFMADGELIYHSRHMLPSTGGRQRSFSILYDAENFIPLWVAYPLCRGNMYGSGNRVNDWGILDPNIPAEKQLYMKNSYNGSYDRGHMLPSASRLGSNDDNRQTFYPTNMTPQLSGLNQKKWAVIEGMVRGWAEGCDTLYVVTGAVLQTAGGNESVSYTYCRSDSSKDVAIPNYYYKALLQYRIINGVKSYQAIAIWLPHKPASGAPTKSDVVTIDQLEELTGIDFFVSLDSQTQQSVESTIDYRFWGGIE